MPSSSRHIDMKGTTHLIFIVVSIFDPLNRDQLVIRLESDGLAGLAIVSGLDLEGGVQHRLGIGLAVHDGTVETAQEGADRIGFGDGSSRAGAVSRWSQAECGHVHFVGLLRRYLDNRLGWA